MGLGIEGYAEAMALRTIKGGYTGIRVHLRLPSSGDVGGVTAADVSVHYFNYYIGFDNEIEGGVSYSKKGVPGFRSGAWRKFLNPGKPSVSATNVAFGSRLLMEMRITRRGEVEFSINNNLVDRTPRRITTRQAKMVMAVADNVGRNASHQVWYTGAQYDQVWLQRDYSDEWTPGSKGDFRFNVVRPRTRRAVMSTAGSQLLGTAIPQPR